MGTDTEESGQVKTVILKHCPVLPWLTAAFERVEFSVCAPVEFVKCWQNLEFDMVFSGENAKESSVDSHSEYL